MGFLPIGGLVASGTAGHSANARSSMSPGAVFKAALPHRGHEVLRFRYNT